MRQGDFTDMPTIYDRLPTPIVCSGSPSVCSRTSFASENGGVNAISAGVTLDTVALNAQKVLSHAQHSGTNPQPGISGCGNQ